MMGPLMGGYKHANFDAAEYAMTVDGNSISDAAVSDLILQLQAIAPISGKFTVTNKAINGQNTQQMIANASDVDSSYVNGKRNILFVWELTNNIHNIGRTGPQTIQDTIDYIAARQAYVAANRPGQKPWIVVLATGTPRGDFLGPYFTAEQAEVEMQYCNAYIRNNYKVMGATAYVEMRRAGGPWDFTDVNNAANFPSTYWRDKTHPKNGAGGGTPILASYIADVLKRLPAR
jgi:hypothetical protein